jgi:UDP-N-acetylmuramoyl-L-alanyl-D-glutamate--2,6-diaminopimelate ligase
VALLHIADTDAAVRWLRGGTTGTLRTDSRQVRPGDAFFAWPGRTGDGRRFVGAALRSGAARCLVDDAGADPFGFDDARIAALPGLKAAAGTIADAWHGEPSRSLHVIAVTGTNGKSSVAWWTAQALSALGRRCGVIGTLGVGEPPGRDHGPAGPLHSTGLTTPDAVALQAALRHFVDMGLSACAIEASSIGIVDHRLNGTRVAVALFTNLTRDHLDYHGSMDGYWAAKRGLFDRPELRSAVVNIDDEKGAELAQQLRRRPGLDLWTYSARGAARLQARSVRYEQGGLAFEVVEGAAALPIRCALIGDYNVGNLLAVLGALRSLGVGLVDAVGAIGALGAVPGRMQRVDASAAGLPEVVVDYAHTPDALEKALQALRPLATARGGRLWCVFGCGGNRDATKRPLMGALAHQHADHVVLTSDNPRDESPAVILAQILGGIPDGESIDVIEDRGAAIADAVARASSNDVILLAGKGHEATQEVAGASRAFSDVEVAAQALRARAASRGDART